MDATLKVPQADEAQLSTSASQSSLNAESNEKHTITNIDLDRIGETQGYVLDEAQLKAKLGLAADATLKTAKDGKTVLIPQPSADPNDPLNWSGTKKSLILLVIAIAACTPDYGNATGAVALLPQATEWRISPNEVNHATAGQTFMIGAGGLFAVWFSACFGRLPVLFFFELVAVATAVWCAAAQSFHSYMAARILNGFFAAAAAGGGLMWIKDMYFFHEHPRKINIWSTALILSPFLGALLMAAIVSATTWRWGMGLCAMITGIGLITTILFVDETFYPRHLMPDQVPARKSRVLRLVGVEQMRTKYIGNTLLGAASRPALAICKLPVLLSCIYYFFTFAWVIGNNTTISIFIIPEYNFTFRNLAALYVAPVLGAIIGQVGGHWLHDFIGNLYAKRHNGRIDPEARLIILWVMTPFNIAGLNMIGSTLQNHWSIWILEVGWCMHTAATITTTTAIGAYVLDAYPEASGEVAAWLNAARTFGGFAVGYVQIIWAQSQGTQKEFGIQSAVVAAVFFIVVFLQFFGAKLRAMQGPLNFKTH